MLEQLRAARLGYGRSYVLRILVMLLVWSSFIIWLTRNESIFPIHYFLLLSMILIPYFVVLGFKVKLQFVPSKSRLIPGWSSAHLTFAVGQIVLVTALLVAISLGASFSNGIWDEWSVVGMLGLLWFEALFFFSLGYLLHPIFVLSLAVAIPALAFGAVSFSQLFSLIADGSRPAAPLLLIVLNAAGTIVLLRRMLFAHEEMPEFQWNVFNPIDMQRRYWASKSAERGLRYRLWAWTNRSLDTIPRRLGKNLSAQIRHFQLGIVMSQGTPIISVVLILTFWILGRFIGTPFIDNNFTFWTAFPISSGFVQTMVSQKNSLQWMFMLPLRRKEIVSRFLGAMFFSILKIWTSVFVAVFVVQWMPFPGTIKEFPSLLPIFASFAALLLIFGIMSLVVMRPSGDAAKRAVRAVAICVILTIVIAVVIARTTGMYDPAPDFSIAAVLTGTGLIWYSYRTWLHADLG